MLPAAQITERNLILTGYLEPNKPRIGRQIAERLGMRFVDIEELVEQRLEMTLAEARKIYGERHILAIQDDVMADLPLYRATLMRINGSALASYDHLPALRQTAFIICLVARLDAILRRMHLTLGARYHNPAERSIAIGELKREWAVRKLAGIHELDVTDQDDASIVAEVMQLWQNIAIERI